MAAKTAVDWLTFRTQAEPLEGLDALRSMYGANGQDLCLRPLSHGLSGWKQGCAVQFADMPIGRVDFGGEAMRGWVRWSLTGQGCSWVRDWDAVADVEALPRAQIKRLDIALTTWEGEVSHRRVALAHQAGKFCSGGRPPDMRMITSSNPRAGATCEVGTREKADKFFRGYEKGFELAAKLGPMAASCTHIEGHRIEDIYRCEVEFKAVNKDIPWEVIERRDQYFAGTYPFLAELLPEAGRDILLRRPERASQVELMTALANLKVQYGATLFTALAAYHGDMFKVWDQVIGQQHNPALLAAGVLLVEHE